MQDGTLLLAEVSKNIRNYFIEIYELDPAIFFLSTFISLVSMSEGDRGRIRIVDRCRYAANGRQRHQRWNVSRISSRCKSQQQVHERL